MLTENPQLNDTLAQYELPIVTHSTIESDGYGTHLRANLPGILLTLLWQN